MAKVTSALTEYREKLLIIDQKLIELLQQRASLSEEIGALKFTNNMEIKQNEYWEQASKTRNEVIGKTQLSLDLTNQIFEIIQQQAIQIQEKTIKKLQHEQK